MGPGINFPREQGGWRWEEKRRQRGAKEKENITQGCGKTTLYFEQVLNLTLKKLSSGDNLQIKTLASGNPFVFVEDQMGNIMLVGYKNGAQVSAGTAVTGNEFGDLNGYTLSFTANERYLANFYATPETFTTDFTIVEGV